MSTKTLGDLIDRRKRVKFTNRYDEISLFNSLLTHNSTEFNVLNIYGVGGIGKSTLINEFVKLIREQDVSFALIEGSTKQTIAKFSRTIRKQLSGNEWWSPFRGFDKDLNRYLEIQSKIEKSKLPQQALKFISNIGGIIDPTGLYNKLGKETFEMGVSFLSSLFKKKDVDFFIQAEQILAERLVQALAKTSSNKLIIILDSYDKFPIDVKDWIERSFAPNLSEHTILVLACRHRLSGVWTNWESTGILRQIELLSFNKASTRKLLAKAGIIEENLVDETFEFTQGHPLCISLTIEMGVKFDKKFLIIDTLIERVLGQITDMNLNDFLYMCAIPRYFNQDIAYYLCNKSGKEILDINILKDFTFIRSVEHGFVMHDVVRDFLVVQLKQRSLEKYRILNEAALEYFQQVVRNQTPFTSVWSEYTLEIAYHQLILSEKLGIKNCIEIFNKADSLLDFQLAASVIGELEKFSFKDSTLRFWSKILRARYVYMKRFLEKAALEYNELLIHAKTEEQRLVVLNGLAIVYTDINRLDEGLLYSEKALVLAEKLGDKDGLLEALYTIGKVMQRQGRFQEGIDILQNRIPKKNTGYKKVLLLEMLGLLHLSSDKLKQASGYYKRAMKVWQKIGNDWKIAIAQYGLSSVFCRQKKWYDAVEILEKALLTLQNVDDTRGIANCLSKLAQAKIGTSDLSEAISLAEQSLSLYNSLGDWFGWALSQNILALAYRHQGEPIKAIECYEKSLDIAQKAGNKEREIATLLNLARAYLENKDKNLALTFAKRALNIAQDFQILDIKNQVIELLNRLQ